MDIKKEIKKSFNEIKKTEEHFESVDEDLIHKLLDAFFDNKEKDDKAITNILGKVIEGSIKNDQVSRIKNY